MQLNTNEVHVWSTSLTITPEQEEEKLSLLSPDECVRATRFRFPLHRQQFIAARSTLRQILSLYLHLPPQDIVFSYGEHKKPYLNINPPTPLNFNLAHSHQIAVYALTCHHAIGIDIEKIKEDNKEAIVDRYFSPVEKLAFKQLSPQEKIRGFYHLWTGKEALIKALGKGLFFPLSNVSISIKKDYEIITLENDKWTLISLALHPDYQAALATNQIIKKILYFNFLNEIPVLDKTSIISQS